MYDMETWKLIFVCLLLVTTVSSVGWVSLGLWEVMATTELSWWGFPPHPSNLFFLLWNILPDTFKKANNRLWPIPFPIVTFYCGNHHIKFKKKTSSNPKINCSCLQVAWWPICWHYKRPCQILNLQGYKQTHSELTYTFIWQLHWRVCLSNSTARGDTVVRPTCTERGYRFQLLTTTYGLQLD